MRFLYFAIRFVQVFFAACLVFVLLLVLFSQIEQRVFRGQAARLLSIFQSLELRKTSWQEAQDLLKRWSPDTSLHEPCDEHRCALGISSNDFVLGQLKNRGLLTRVDDYLRWRFKLAYDFGPFAKLQNVLLPIYVRLGGRPAEVRMAIAMRDGVVWRKSLAVGVASFVETTKPWGGLYELIGEARTVNQLNNAVRNGVSANLKRHPFFLIGRPSGCMGCIEGWFEFTPYADRADILRLSNFDLSCLTRWKPCRTQADLMPAAWSQYTTESGMSDSNDDLECSPVLLHILGRDSGSAFLGEIVGTQRNKSEPGYIEGSTVVRLLEEYKGRGGWPVGTTRSIELRSDRPCATTKVKAGDRLTFLGNWEYPGVPSQVPRYLTLQPLGADEQTHLRQGIEQDFDSH